MTRLRALLSILTGLAVLAYGCWLMLWDRGPA